MNDVTRILEAACEGDPKAGAELLPLVYSELRRLAAVKMANQGPGQTLQATSCPGEHFGIFQGMPGNVEGSGLCHALGHQLLPTTAKPDHNYSFMGNLAGELYQVVQGFEARGASVWLTHLCHYG